LLVFSEVCITYCVKFQTHTTLNTAMEEEPLQIVYRPQLAASKEKRTKKSSLLFKTKV